MTLKTLVSSRSAPGASRPRFFRGRRSIGFGGTGASIARTPWRLLVHGKQLVVVHDLDVAIAAGAGGVELVRAAQLHLAGAGELDFLQARGDDLDVGTRRSRPVFSGWRRRCHCLQRSFSASPLSAWLCANNAMPMVGSFRTKRATSRRDRLIWLAASCMLSLPFSLVPSVLEALSNGETGEPFPLGTVGTGIGDRRAEFFSPTGAFSFRPKFRLGVRYAAGWFQRVDATLYSRGKRWSRRMNGKIFIRGF